MTRRIEPPLAHMPAADLLRHLHDAFGESWEEEHPEPSRCYRMAVVTVLKVRYGTPTPPSLFPLIDEAGFIGVHPDDLVQFIGGEFNLTPMRRFAAA